MSFHIKGKHPDVSLVWRDVIPDVVRFVMHKWSRRVRQICDVVGELVGCALSPVLAFLAVSHLSAD